MNKPLHLFVGPSASGKTSVANELEKYGYKQVYSYCTREPRYEGEPGHVFVSKSEFDALENKVAYTEYDNTFYCTTKEQLDECDIYVVDVPGVKTLIENYNTDRKIYIWSFNSELVVRVQRMRDRGNSDTFIVDRIIQDEEYDWYHVLLTLREYALFFKKKTIELNYVDADVSLNDLVHEMRSKLGE